MSKQLGTVEVIKVICDFCGELTGETQWKSGFQHIKSIGPERPLKLKWYEVFRFWGDKYPTYDVHHTCLYELLKAYKEGTIVRKEK